MRRYFKPHILKQLTQNSMALSFLKTGWILICLVIPSILFCQTPSSPTPNSTDVVLNPTLTWSDNTGLPANYTLEVWECAAPVNHYQLDNYFESLYSNPNGVELSGMTYSSATNSQFVVSDGLFVYEMSLTGVTLRTIPLNGFGDTESIVHIENNTFGIIEERLWEIVFVTIDASTTSINKANFPKVTLTHPSIIYGDNTGMEASGYDPSTNKIFILEEKIPSPRIFEFIIPTSFSGNVTPLAIHDDPFGYSDYAGLHYLGKTEGSDCLGADDHFLLLSQENFVVIEADINGTVYGTIDLTAGGANGTLGSTIPQAEGVTMDRNRNIYVVGEDNDYYRFSITNPAAPMFSGSTPVYSITVNSATHTLPSNTLNPNQLYCWRIKNDNNMPEQWSSVAPFCTGSSNALPIELTYFKAYLENHKVDILWETASEFNHDFFSIEKSNNGIDFHEIHQTPGKGSISSSEQYHFTDQQPVLGLNYYRLKSFAIDGSYALSEIQVVEYDDRQQYIVISPNPSALNTDLNIVLTGFEASKEIVLQIFDTQGRLVNMEQIQGSQDKIFLNRNYPFSKSGLYFFKAVQGVKSYQKAFMITSE